MLVALAVWVGSAEERVSGGRTISELDSGVFPQKRFYLLTEGGGGTITWLAGGQRT